MDPTDLTPEDLAHLRRCVDLAREALEAGDEPFGSVLVDPQGSVLREERNRTGHGDQTRHPELDLARWAAVNVAPEVRPDCTVYTSGEHCPMCAAGHAWVGLGRIVYAASTAQFTQWRQDLGLAPGPVVALPINAIAPDLPVAGPAPRLADEVRELFARNAARDDSRPGRSVYDAAGGKAGLERLAGAWHDRVMTDEVVSHAFGHGFDPHHLERLAAYWGEALGGPAAYTHAFGDESTVVRMHSGNGPHEEMSQRAVACFDRALTDVGLAEEDPVRSVLHDYFAWATFTTMNRYEDSADEVPEGLRIPRWSWGGLVDEDSTP